MNKTKKKGFTLVELLAVIVILAVVILIAVTAVVPRMNNAKKKAFIDEALIYYKAGKEAYVTDPSAGCYNVSDMSSLVKQTKDGYTGTVNVNEKGVSLNLTNGKYYLKTSTTPEEIDISETLPDKFVSTCDSDLHYSITYELNGGTVSGTNPSEYYTKTGTDVLINPTKSGYRFVGWSSKNILNINEWLDSFTRTIHGSTVKYEKSLNLTSTQDDCFTGSFGSSYQYKIPVKSGTDYTLSWKTDKQVNEGIVYVFSNNSTDTGYRFAANSKTTNHLTFTPASDINFITIRFGVAKADKSIYYSNIQIEESSTPTDYQDFMAPTKNAKVYKGETGNKTFVANWGPLVYHVTLDNQGATEGGTPEVYYEINKVRSINGVVCYYYSDSEVTNCIRNGYYIELPVKTGYTFGGYYTEPNGGGTQYVDSTGSFVNNIYQKSGDRTLYAKWTAN